MVRKKRLAALVFTILFFISPMLVRAQSGTSSVQGTVTDSTGAVIPGASVILTNNATGVALNATSDSSGSYSFPSVLPGVYSLEITKEAFASYKLSQFKVIVGQHANESATLNVAATASVVVNASGLSNQLDTQSNDLGTVIGPQSVQQLPLNGRNYLQLGLLSGATQPTSGAANGSIAQTGHPGMSINIAGNQPDFTMYVVNGLQTLGSRAGNTSLNLSTGAIDQFEVHYGFFMPDMGPNPGIVDVVTKSGSNHIHGEAYEFVRTNQMQARNYFALTGTGVPIPPGPYHQNQFGFDFGGPVLKNKLFYFVNYEGYRQTQSALQTAHTPTAAMFSGDFSGAGVNIYDPTTFDPATGKRAQFSGNIIPSTSIAPAAKALLAYYLPGSSLSVSNNVTGTPKQTLNSDQFMGRIDYNLNARNQVFAQGNWLNSPATSPGLFPSQGVAYPLDTELVNVGWNWTISSTKVNELRLGGIRDSVYDEGVPVEGLQQKLNITGTADPNGVPGINISGFAGFGTSTGLIGNLDNGYQIHDGFNWLHGNHQIKFGAEIAYLRTIQSSANANARGVFTFNDTYTAQIAPNGSGGYTPVANTGSAFADFLLGDLTNGQSIGMPRTHLRWTTFEPYVQDTWKITPGFTANIALAWYGATSPNAVGSNANLIHGFDFTLGKPTFAALGQMSPSVYPMTKTNWAPRIGFNYQPSFLKNTVVRAGWGIYYTTQEAVNFQYAVVSQVITINNAVSNTQPKPTYILGTNAMPTVPVGQITQPQADAITGPIQYLSQNQHSPYVLQWNFDIQRTFASKYLLDIAYIGNGSRHLALNWNPFDCSSPGSNICLDSNNPYNGKFTYMQEVNSIGTGNYNALLVKFQRQFSGGLSILANYAWSKALAASQQGSNGTLNQRRSCLLACDYGPTTSNIPQSLIISAVWQIPVGRGRYFGSNINPFLNALVGGWDIDAIVTMQKGTPFTLTAPNNTAWSPGVIRANTYCNGRSALTSKDVRSNGHYWLKGQTVGQTQFQGACYVDPSKDPVNLTGPGGTLPGRAAFGTTSYDSMTGPGLNNWDIGTHKSFTLYREMNFTIRGEYFNAWNHAQFANPVSGVAASNFGQVTATQRDNREIQIGGTFTF
jgi:Carboxypeptidase regulatory-like domain